MIVTESTHLLGFAGSGQWQDVVRMSGVAVAKAQGAYRDFAKGAIEGHRLAIVIVADRRALGPGALATARLPAASRWPQIVGRQRTPLRMAGFPACVAI